MFLGQMVPDFRVSFGRLDGQFELLPSSGSSPSGALSAARYRRSSSLPLGSGRVEVSVDSSRSSRSAIPASEASSRAIASVSARFDRALRAAAASMNTEVMEAVTTVINPIAVTITTAATILPIGRSGVASP
jgi:hypothetical protein